MANVPVEPLNLELFWRTFSRFVMRQLKERGQTEITLVLRDGHFQVVRLNRSFFPQNLPEP